MAAHRELLLLLLLAAAVVAALAAVASADDAKPTILTPVAQTPLGSFDGDTPASDDDSVEDDDDAAPVGAPTGATMTEPSPSYAPHQSSKLPWEALPPTVHLPTSGCWRPALVPSPRSPQESLLSD